MKATSTKRIGRVLLVLIASLLAGSSTAVVQAFPLQEAAAQETSGGGTDADIAIPPLAPDLTIQEITTAQYAGAVSAAMEAMRLVYGDLSPAEEQKFLDEWAPLFEYPCQEVIDYLGRLNPLLSEFLSVRSAMQTAAVEFDSAWNEAIICGILQFEDGIREALAIAYLKKQMLTGLSQKLEQIVEAIGALGGPPDVAAIRAAAARNHRAAKRALDPGPQGPFDGEWVGNWETQETSDEKGAFDNTFESFKRALESVRNQDEDLPDSERKFNCHLRFTTIQLEEDELEDSQLRLHLYNYDDMQLLKLEVDPRLQGLEHKCENWLHRNRNLILPPLNKLADNHYQLEYESRFHQDWMQKWVWDFELDGDELVITEKGYARSWGVDYFDEGDPLLWGPKAGLLRTHSIARLRRPQKGPADTLPKDYSVKAAKLPQVDPQAGWVLAKIERRLPEELAGREFRIDAEKGRINETFKFYDRDPQTFEPVQMTVSHDYQWTPLPERIRPDEVIDLKYSVKTTAPKPDYGSSLAVTDFLAISPPDFQRVDSNGTSQHARQLFLPSVPYIEGAQDPIVVYAGGAQVEYWYQRVPIEAVDEVIVEPLSDPQPVADPSAEEADRQSRLESIAFHRDCIRIIEYNLERDKAELAQTTDPDRRAEFVSRILNNQHNIFSELDRIREIETGEIVHTRTPIDALYKAKWEESIVRNVQEVNRAHKLFEGLNRLAGLAPEDQRGELRAFIARHANPGMAVRGETAPLERLVEVVGNRVQGHWEGEAAQSLDQALQAADILKRLEGVQGWSEFALMAYTFGYGNHALMIGYQAGVGYALTEGSKSDRIYEATKRGLAWYNQATYIASEAMVGYEKGGWFGDNKGSIWGSIERAGEAFLLVKGFEFAAGKVFGVPPTAAEKQAYVKQRFEIARRQQAIEDGISLVDDYQRAYNEYQRALEFGASQAEIQAMEAALRRRAASIHATYESKLFLKRVGSDPRFSPMIADFNQRMGQIHAEVRQQFRQGMRDLNYQHVDDWFLQEFRNASSLGTVNMDHDVGILDRIPGGPTGERSITFVKNNLRVSPIRFQQDAQKAWEQAYQRTTGYSARQSFEELTTRTVHPEAYRDLSWLGNETLRTADVGNIASSYAAQAGDVTAFKASTILANPSLQRLQRIVEASRGTAKDIESKLVPVLEEAARRILPTNSTRALQIDRYRQHWQKISKVLANASDDPIGVDRQLRQITGNRGLPEVVDDVREMISNYGKFIGN